ncbi:MAG: T9SS type A sorting domain-containing protein [Bacteroidia bacterium]|nr:T9SS type A sorting domain-containing protein [Bacteroidia bacterium]
MKTTVIMGAFLLSTTLLVAQSTDKKATVRIKKIENINGVEKITDTTYTTNDPGSIKLENGTIDIIGNTGDAKDGNMVKTIIINDENGKQSNVDLSELSKEMDIELKKALKEAGIDENTVDGKKVMIIKDEDNANGDNKKEKHITKTIVIKKIDITDASDDDMKRIGKSAGVSDGQLKIEKMNFYPNPSNGKFNLSFNLPEKQDTEITILNVEGKVVYKEKLNQFSGNYDKEIDISKNAKGVYFVKVDQGKHAQVKKIILE